MTLAVVSTGCLGNRPSAVFRTTPVLGLATPSGSGIQGDLVAQQRCDNCPHEIEGVVGAVLIEHPDASNVVARTVSRNGSFAVPLPPGSYVLVVIPRNVVAKCPSPQFNVESGRWVEVEVFCLLTEDP